MIGVITRELPHAGVAVRPLERRVKTRYDVYLGEHHHTLNKKHRSAGAGVVLNLSSTGMLVAGTNEVHIGEPVEVSVDWPELLNGNVRLQLVAVGKVVRCDPSHFAIAFQHHEFRTRSSHAQAH